MAANPRLTTPGIEARTSAAGVPTRYDPCTLQSARHVQAVAEAAKPKLLLHGHWHQFQQVRLPGPETEVIGLSTDGTRKSWMVLDLPGLEITDEPA